MKFFFFWRRVHKSQYTYSQGHMGDTNIGGAEYHMTIRPQYECRRGMCPSSHADHEVIYSSSKNINRMTIIIQFTVINSSAIFFFISVRSLWMWSRRQLLSLCSVMDERKYVLTILSAENDLSEVVGAINMCVFYECGALWKVYQHSQTTTIIILAKILAPPLPTPGFFSLLCLRKAPLRE